MASSLYDFPAITAADTIDMQSSGFSKYASALTAGAETAMISGSLSVYNTFLDYMGQEQYDTERVIREHDAQLGEFYSQNKEIVDLAGFVGTSMIPGTLGVKALRLAQAGQATGAISRALQLVPSKKNLYFNKALEAMSASGGTVTSQVLAAKRAQFAWATADQLMTSTAFELGVLATMNDSPMFEDATYWDFAKNVGMGAAFGGVVGGVIEHWGARGILKQAQRKIESARREFDTVFDPARMGLAKSDEILNFTESILKLPDDYFNVNFSYTIDGKSHTKVLETAGAFKDVKTRAEKVAFDTLALKMNELAEGGEVTGQAMYGFIMKQITDGRAKGQAAEEIIDTVRGYVAGVKKISNVDEEIATAAKPKHFFINRSAVGLDDLFTETRAAGTSKQAYYLKTTDPTQIKFGKMADLGVTKSDDAFKLGYDAVINEEGRVVINNQSKVIGKVADPALNTRFYLDLESGALTTERMVTAADLVKRATDLQFYKDAVAIGRRSFKQAATVSADLERSTVETSARFMWASKLPESSFAKREVAWDDFALLDRMAQMPPGRFATAEAPKIKLPDGTSMSTEDIVDIGRYVNELKLQWLEDTLGKQAKGYDLRQLSNALNVSREWLEEAIASGFQQTHKIMNEARSLKEYFKPQTVMMEWDPKMAQVGKEFVGPVGPNHALTPVLGQHYRMVIQQNITKNAADSVLGEDAARFMESAADLAKQTTSEGTGASMFGAANADYGRQAELFAQETGKQVSLVSQKWRDATLTHLAPFINQIRDDAEAAAELGILTTRLRRDPRKYYLETYVADDGTDGFRLVDREVQLALEKGDFADIDEAVDFVRMNTTEEVAGYLTIKNSKVGDFLRMSRELNGVRVDKSTTLFNARGLKSSLDRRAVYIPPVDTSRYPHFAFVVAKEKIGSITDVAMITAKDPEQLRQLALKVGDEYEVVFKNDTKKFFKARGIYDYNMQLNESRINSALQRRGILGDFFPETRAENVLEDYVRWHANSEDNLVRTAVQVKHTQFFSELGFLSEQFQSAGLSATKGLGFLKKNLVDPFDDYRKTALNLSKQSEYQVLDSFNEFVDKLGTGLHQNLTRFWESFRGSEGKDLVSLQKANQLMDDYGLNMPYKTMEDYLVANERMPRNAIRESFQKVNLWLATTVLRFDFANSLVNIISTPIMIGTEMSSIRSLIKKDPELVGALQHLTSVKVPGRDASMPSTSKLIGQAVNNYFGKDKLALIQRYKDNGDIKEVSQLFHEVLDDLAYQPGRKVSDWQKKVDAAIEKGATITGNNFSEEFTRFVSADVMRQLTDPLVAKGVMGLKDQNAYISSFVNRVQGNYISSQRPIVFQGTTGSAIGLFQTYAFNVLQQLFRHMENRDMRTMLTFMGLQTSIYGMNGLPFFDAINQHLIGAASGNEKHLDAYSVLPAANKEIGEWLLYGTASAFPLFGDKMPALYSRGDMNPRHLSIVPVNPLDIPAVSASIKLFDSISGFGKQVVNGADISTAALRALEHHGWNRPLAGFAQVLAGESTTGKGSLVSAANDMETTSLLTHVQERMVDFGGAARMLGAKPMDEAVALSTLYRNKAYQAMDRARIDALGEVIKTKLGNNQMPTDEELEDFMQDYVKAGGRIETFSSSLQRWMRDSNRSIVNQMSQKLGSTYGKNLQLVMGGEELEDYTQQAASE